VNLFNPLDWLELVSESHRRHIEALQKYVEASQASIDPARKEEAGELLGEANEKAREAAEGLARAQWAWLGMWRF